MHYLACIYQRHTATQYSTDEISYSRSRDKYPDAQANRVWHLYGVFSIEMDMKIVTLGDRLTDCLEVLHHDALRQVRQAVLYLGQVPSKESAELGLDLSSFSRSLSYAKHWFNKRQVRNSSYTPRSSRSKVSRSSIWNKDYPRGVPSSVFFRAFCRKEGVLWVVRL